MNRSLVRKGAAVSSTILGAFLVAAVATPFFLKNVVGMGKESANTVTNAIMTGMDVASAVGLVSGGAAVGAIVIWGIKKALKSGGKKAVIA
ncbi:hypothetical protein ACIBKX_22900 [Streptomyces sp. NPDC050658]|uniref:hypothetical protein n=1 Tax=unclassified Streptomyces TaxID=2593676 RepID=UPI0034409B89